MLEYLDLIFNDYLLLFVIEDQYNDDLHKLYARLSFLCVACCNEDDGKS